MKPLLLFFAILVSALAVVPLTRAQDAKPPKPEAPFTEFLSGLTLGDGIIAGQLIVFPVLAPEPPAAMDIVPDMRTDQLLYEEVEWPERPFNIGVTNQGSRPVLILGGGLVVGGSLDRMLPRDLLVPPKQQLEIETLPAEYPKDRRSPAVPFLRTSLAPGFLRERAVSDPSRYLVPIFISHFLEFRDPGDERRSLAAIDQSAALATYCLECQRAVAEFPDLAGGRVVGFATVVRGRLHGLELFGTNQLLRAWFGTILRAHAYEAAAIFLRAKDLGINIPRSEEEMMLVLPGVTESAQNLLDALKKGKFRVRRDAAPGEAGTTILVRTPRSQGSAIIVEDRMVHASIHPQNPFAEALFSRPIELPEEAGGVETNFGGLERRAGRGTLTEEEQRLLERMRARRE